MIIELFYSITAFVSLFTLLIILFKYVAKRLSKKSKLFQNVNKLLMKYHKPLFYSLLITGMIHGILTFSRLDYFGITPYILGTVCFLSCVGAALSFYYRRKMKTSKNWIIYHRLFAISAVVSFAIHIALTR